MEKALIYSRVSTEEQAQEGRHSLKTQESLCRKIIAENNKYTLADEGVYVDAGKTATNMNRAGLQDLLIRVQEDKSVGAVFVLDTDRLARNATDHLTIKSILKKHNVTLISISQPGIDDTVEGNFMDLVMAGVNQLQSQITARKTIKSMEQKFNEGGCVTRTPVGYLNAGDPNNLDKRIVVVDPIKAPLVVELFKKYSTGSYSMFELRDILHKKGLTSLSGGKLGVANMFAVIKNPFFYGLMRWRDMTKTGKHTPLISRELYDRCQKVREDHNHHACRRRKYDFLLRGYLFSATSGLRFIGENHPKKEKSYYRPYLTNKNRPGKIAEEDKPITVGRIEEQVIEQFVGIEFSEQFIERLLERVRFMYDLKKRDVTREKKKWIATRAIAENKLAVAEEKLISNTLDDIDFTRIKNKQRVVIANCDEEIAKIERGKYIKVDVIQKVILLARNIGEAYRQAPPELKRVYLSLFWDRFELSNRKLVNATPSPIIEALVASGTLNFSNKHKPVPLEKRFAYKNESFRDAIRIRTFGGD